MVAQICSRARPLIEAVNRHIGDRQIYFCTASGEHDYFQALAVPITKREYCVVMFLGAYLHPRMVLQSIIGRNVFSKFFNHIEVEIEETPIAQDQYATYHAILNKRGLPRLDDRRSKLLALASDISIHWLLHHELAHMLNGHLGLVAGGYAEMDQGFGPPTEHLTRHVLEMDADTYAFHQVVRFFSQHKTQVCRHLDGHAGQEDQLVMGVVLLAIFSTIKCMEHRKIDEADFWSGTHPPPAERAYYLSLLGNEYAFNGWTPEKFAEFYVGFEAAFSDATGVSFEDGNSLTAHKFREESPYFDLMLARWAKLRPELLEHKFGPNNLAPAQRPPA